MNLTGGLIEKGRRVWWDFEEMIGPMLALLKIVAAIKIRTCKHRKE